MKRSNFLKTLFAIPLIPLVGNIIIEDVKEKGLKQDTLDLVKRTGVTPHPLYAEWDNVRKGDVICDEHGEYLCVEKGDRILAFPLLEKRDDAVVMREEFIYFDRDFFKHRGFIHTGIHYYLGVDI